MKQAFILVITLFGAHICQAHIPACTTHTSISMVTPEEDESEENDEEEDEKGTKIPLRVNKENPGNEEPEKELGDRSLVFIPEVYLNAHTLTFVTPCTSGVVEILQQGTVVYAETVTAQSMLLPSALQGTYELQLTWCGVNYRAEITL